MDLQNVTLTCRSCGADSGHELLYVSGHLVGHRCTNCGATAIYTSHVYGDYAKEFAVRTARLPRRLVTEAVRTPRHVAMWPGKAARKPFGIVREVADIKGFSRRARERGAS